MGKKMAENDNLNDGITLGGDVAENTGTAEGISLGGDEQTRNDEPKTDSENAKDTGAQNPKDSANNAENTEAKIDDKNRVDVREFYETLVEPFLENYTGLDFAVDYENFLKIGRIPAVEIYRIADIQVYKAITEDDKKRIKEWCRQWGAEAQKLGNKEQQKREALDAAIPTFMYLFTQETKNDDLRDSLKKIAWANLDSLIKDKCSDKIVELDELSSIQDAAIDLGLLDMSDTNSREEFKKELKEKIEYYGAKIDTIHVAMKRFFEEHSEKDSTFTINTTYSQTELINEFQRLKEFHVKLYPEESVKFDNFPTFLAECGIVLKDKIKYFEDDYFDDFKKHVNLKQLQQSIYKGTKKLAMCKEYGFSDRDWETFEKKHNIIPISDQELMRINQRNGIIKNSLKVGGVVAMLAVLFILFRVFFPNEFTAIVSKIAPSEEMKRQNIEIQKAKAEQQKALAEAKAAQERQIAMEKAEQEKALNEERAAREREKYEEEKRLEEERRNREPKTYTVGMGSSYDFHNLQDAVNASKDTDTIILAPGVYKSTANINKRITITSSPDIVSAIKSKYFSSRDVPIIVIDTKSQSKVTANVKISGVVFTTNSALGFTAFSKYLESSANYDRKVGANVSKRGIKWTNFSEDPMSSSYKSMLDISANVDFDGVVFADAPQNGVTLISGSQTFNTCYFANITNNAVLALGHSSATFSSLNVDYTACGAGIKVKEHSTISIANAEFKKCHTGIYTEGEAKGSGTNIKFNSSTIASIRSSGNSNITYSGIEIKNNLLKGSAGIAVEGKSNSTFENVDIQKTYAGIVVAGNSNPAIDGCKVLNSTNYGIVFTENAGGRLSNFETYGNIRGIMVQKKSAPLIAKGRVHDNKEAGITFTGSAKGHIEEVESYANSTGFSINDNTSPVITKSKAYSNNNGFLSSENNTAVIANSESYKNNNSGFAIYEVGSAKFKAKNTIDGCKFTQNKNDGIRFQGATQGTIINTISALNGTGSGVSISESAYVIIRNSRFTGNKFGLRNAGKGVCGVSDSAFEENNDSGALIEGNTKTLAKDCTFDKNLDGFYVKGNAYVEATQCSMSQNSNIGLSIRENSTGKYTNCLTKGNKKKNTENITKAQTKPQFDNDFMTSVKNFF